MTADSNTGRRKDNMNKSESISKLVSALAKAQAAFPQIPRSKTVTVKTRTGGSYTFSYAPLEEIIKSVRPSLHANGLAFVQSVADGLVVTLILHDSGEWVQSGGTPVSAVEQGPQAYGSALTYSRRYDLSLALGLCPDDDDDGNAAEGNEATSKNGLKKAFSAPHKPTDGAEDRVDPARKGLLTDVATSVQDRLNEGKDWDAYSLLEQEVTDPDEKVFIWTFFDSKARRRLKDQAELAKKGIPAMAGAK